MSLLSDKYNIDSHKLIYHPDRVSQWLEGFGNWEKIKSIYPIYLEISPFGACNHRCTFCAVDYIGYQNRSLDPEILIRCLEEMAELGLRSVMFAGEGEPLLYKELVQVLEHCTSVGVDTALTTNLVPLTEKNVDSILRNCSWIKTSINAGTAGTYAQIHQTNSSDFDRVIRNLTLCVEKKREDGYSCTIGAQMILLPDNAHEAFTLGEILRDTGVDYLVVKPYSQHSYSVTRKYEDVDYTRYDELADQVQSLETEDFSVIFRRKTMEKFHESDQAYETCFSTPVFWGYIMSDGCVYGCSAFLGEDIFNFGNIHEYTFKEIWEGEKRRECYEYINKQLDISECRKNCRMDEINRYLWTLRNPDDHVNFI